MDISKESHRLTDKTLDHAWRHIQLANDISRLADTKAGTMLAAAGVTEGSYYAKILG